MQWMITKDCLTDDTGIVKMRMPKLFMTPYDEAGTQERVRMVVDALNSMTHEFRLYDDDGELYFEGQCKDLGKQGQDNAFEPLDWAENDAGCTRMDYRKKGDTEWQTL